MRSGNKNLMSKIQSINIRKEHSMPEDEIRVLNLEVIS